MEAVGTQGGAAGCLPFQAVCLTVAHTSRVFQPSVTCPRVPCVPSQVCPLPLGSVQRQRLLCPHQVQKAVSLR